MFYMACDYLSMMGFKLIHGYAMTNALLIDLFHNYFSSSGEQPNNVY